MPLQKRLPKYGFTSRIGRVSDQIRVGELANIESDVIDLAAIKAAGLVNSNILQVKVFLQGEINKAVTVKGLRVSAGARAAIEAAGGKVED
jgi:large subunit ribosomal protein L15